MPAGKTTKTKSVTKASGKVPAGVGASANNKSFNPNNYNQPTAAQKAAAAKKSAFDSKILQQETVGYKKSDPAAAYENYYNSRQLAAKTDPLSVANYGGGLRDATGATMVNPNMGGSSGGSGGSGLGSGSSGPVGAPVEDPLAALLSQLPQGPQGLESVSGAYQNLQNAYGAANTQSDEAFGKTRASLQQMYGDTAANLKNKPTDFINSLLALNQQNQNTGLGTLDTLQGIRKTYLGDVGTSISARSAAAVSDLTDQFQQLKAAQEQSIIDQYMAAQSAGSSGGGGGGRSSGGGSSSGAKGTISEVVYNPQNQAMLAALAASDPEAAAIAQRAQDLNFKETTDLRNQYDNAVRAAESLTTKAKKASINANMKSGFGALWPKFTAPIYKGQAKKANTTASKTYTALQLARQYGGVQGAPKTTQTLKS